MIAELKFSSNVHVILYFIVKLIQVNAMPVQSFVGPSPKYILETIF